MNQDSLLRIFESIPAHVNNDRHLVHRGRFTNMLIKISVGSDHYLMEIREGKITALQRGMPLFQTADLFISANRQAWEALWQKHPAPGWHDIFALHKRGEMRIEGETQKLFANLQYLKDVLNTPRQFANA